jgi:iron complex outermembrane receptor protein
VSDLSTGVRSVTVRTLRVGFACLPVVMIAMVRPAPVRAQSPDPPPPDAASTAGTTPPPRDEAATTAIEAVSLEDILDMPVVGASRYEQAASDAPASISVVTADDIERHGWRTMDDILRSLRGVTIVDDRNYHYIGVRGFGIPGDYNSRILVLIDGHRVNDAIYESAGNEWSIDVENIERLEFIRGPSSSVYGSSAFFGVINVITKTGAAARGVSASAETGAYAPALGSPADGSRLALASTRVRGSAGWTFARDVEVFASASYLRDPGQPSLYYPELEDPAAMQTGIADDMDAERRLSVSGKARYGPLTLAVQHDGRRKNVPTAPFGADAGYPGVYTVDTASYADLAFRHTSSAHGVDTVARAYLNRYTYEGDYPYGGVINRDEAVGLWAGAEAQVTKRLELGVPRLSNLRVSAGGEYQNRFQLDQRNFDIDPSSVYMDSREQGQLVGVYAQSEATVLERLVVNAGVRYDNWIDLDSSVNPRFALIWRPRDGTNVKLLLGSAFRAPNAYERFYTSTTYVTNPALRSERIRTAEVVVEQYLGEDVRALVAGYLYRIDDLIALRTDPATDLLVFDNISDVDGRGAELEIEARLAGDVRGRAGYTLASTTGRRDGVEAELPNSPRHVVKLALVAPLLRDRLSLSAEAHVTSERLSSHADMAPVDGSFVAHAAALWRLPVPGVTLTASVRNLLDGRHVDPGSEEHVQSTIRQNGRTAWLELAARY